MYLASRAVFLAATGFMNSRQTLSPADASGRSRRCSHTGQNDRPRISASHPPGAYPSREPLLRHQLRPLDMVERAVGQISGRNTATSNRDEPLIHTAGAQKQIGILRDTPPKPRVDHHEIAIDRPALLATIVPEYPAMAFPT